MMTYQTDTITEDKDGQKSVYVKLVDDKGLVLDYLCIAYKNEAAFEAELQRKTEKYLATATAKESIEPTVAAVYKRIEAKMDTLKKAAAELSQEKEITP